jgi:hypothetical protein
MKPLIQTLISVIVFFSTQLLSQNIGTSAYVNINEIYLPFNNKGVIADINVGPNGSTGQFAGGTFLFSSGFWLSGYTNGTMWANGVASASLVEDYQAGIVGMDPLDPNAAIFKLSAADIPFGQSWQDWINAVQLGADYYDGDGNGIYNPVDLNGNNQWNLNEDRPDIFLDETFWTVFNDGVPSNQRRWLGEQQGIEIRQTIFAMASSEPVNKVVFIRYRLKNTGLKADTLKNVYFSVWSDPDIGDFIDDSGACDTIRNGTYAYNFTPDAIYGNQVPAFMTDMLTGPYSYIPGITFIDNNGNNTYETGIDTPIDTAISYRGPLGVVIYPGAKNLKMSASIHYINGHPSINDPTTQQRARWYMLGLDNNGNVVNPCNFPLGVVRGGVPCNQINPLFWFSGNPVTDVGWIFDWLTDIRQVQTSGPFTLIKNEEIEVLVAYEINRSTDPLSGITALRTVSDYVQEFYENNFGQPLLGIDSESHSSMNYILNQNFPNPFNPSTQIKFRIAEFGYITLKVYDLLGREITTLVNEEKAAGEYEVEFSAKGGSASGGNEYNLPSGIYFYQLRAGNFVETKKMVLIR